LVKSAQGKRLIATTKVLLEAKGAKIRRIMQEQHSTFSKVHTSNASLQACLMGF
jgi:hypothetical protein